MKNIYIPAKTLTLSNKEALLVEKILTSLGIEYESEELPIVRTNKYIYNILPELETRTANCLKTLVNEQLSMTLSAFIESYTWEDFMRIRNTGKHSLKDLRCVLKNHGYNF